MRKKIVYSLLSLLFCTLLPVYAQQPADYPVKEVNGVEYYVYTVAPGEGLYAISRRFGVTQAEINNANAQIHDGLKAGQTILIPKKKQIAPPSSPQVNYLHHTVERRQTLFSISRKYGVSQEAIVEANPQLQHRGIQVGDVLRIPTTKQPSQLPPSHTPANSTPSPGATQPTLHIGARESYITHRVVQGETLYSISRKYNSSVNDIKKLNPDLHGLLAGTVLKIPFTAANTTKETQTPSAPTNQKTTYKIAYLLPFMTEDKNDRTADKFIEFYMGALLAINNAKHKDAHIEVYAFDTEKTETKLFEIINKPQMQDIDLIIGPAYTAQIPILADFAKRRQIHTIIPFSSKVAYIETNPYLYQFNPDKDIQNDYVMHLLKNNFKNTHIVFIETSNNNWSEEEGTDFFTHLKERLDKQRTKYTTLTGTQINGGWEAVLATDRKNVIIFDTDSYKTVQKYLAELHEMGGKFDLAVMGQYSWRGQNGKKPKMYYVSPFAGNKLGTQYYEQEYQKYYNKQLPTTNPRFDLLGYDITTYFLSTMKAGGFTLNAPTETFHFDNGVQSDFEFRRTSRYGGFVNHKLYVIEDDATAK